MRIVLSTFMVCGLALHSAAAIAQEAPSDDSPHGMVAIGAGVVPKYDGASDVRALPFVLGDVRWHGIGLELRGAGLRVDLVSNPRLAIGPVIGAHLPRNNVDGPVGLLPEIGTAIEAGGFVGYRFGGNETGQGSLQVELSVVHDVSDTHDGRRSTSSSEPVGRRP